jgi:hypothetical protein
MKLESVAVEVPIDDAALADDVDAMSCITRVSVSRYPVASIEVIHPAATAWSSPRETRRALPSAALTLAGAASNSTTDARTTAPR